MQPVVIVLSRERNLSLNNSVKKKHHGLSTLETVHLCTMKWHLFHIVQIYVFALIVVQLNVDKNLECFNSQNREY